MNRSRIQTAILNVVAIIVGIIILFIANTLITFAFGIILSFPIIAALLSWPSTPTLYALTASNIASVYLGGMACYKICSPTKGGFLPGMLGYGLICFALFVLSAYGIFMQYGFCDAVICHIFGAILSAAMISGAKSEECRLDL